METFIFEGSGVDHQEELWWEVGRCRIHLDSSYSHAIICSARWASDISMFTITNTNQNVNKYKQKVRKYKVIKLLTSHAIICSARWSCIPRSDICLNLIFFTNILQNSLDILNHAALIIYVKLLFQDLYSTVASM